MWCLFLGKLPVLANYDLTVSFCYTALSGKSEIQLVYSYLDPSLE